MKRTRFSEEQIIGILKESEAGRKTDELCRQHGVSKATFYEWRKKFHGLSVSDADLDSALAALGLETLEPNRGVPATRALWRPSGADWHLVALLVDAVEPLERHASVRSGTAPPAFVQRCGLGGAAVGVMTFTPKRANSSWTRVLLVADSPGRPTSDVLTLTMHTSDGDAVGARRVGARPAQLDREGL